MALVYFELNPGTKVEGTQSQALPLSVQKATCVPSGLLYFPKTSYKAKIPIRFSSSGARLRADKNLKARKLTYQKNFLLLNTKEIQLVSYHSLHSGKNKP